MTKTIEQEALDLINEVFSERESPGDSCVRRAFNSTHEALCRALEQLLAEREAHAATKAEFEAFRREVSDAVEEFDKRSADFKLRQQDWEKLFSFIIPKPKPDPLAEVQSLLDEGLTLEEAVGNLGLKLVEVGDAD